MVEKKERDLGLDLVKIVATVFMIKLHTRYDGLPSEILHYMAGSAIPLFFMVSGSVTLSIHKELTAKYVGVRILRVLRVIGIWAILFSIVAIIQTRMIVNPVTLVLGSFVQNGWLSHFWYLWSLIILYTISLFLKRYLKDNKCACMGGYC